MSKSKNPPARENEQSHATLKQAEAFAYTLGHGVLSGPEGVAPEMAVERLNLRLFAKSLDDVSAHASANTDTFSCEENVHLLAVRRQYSGISGRSFLGGHPRSMRGM